MPDRAPNRDDVIRRMEAMEDEFRGVERTGEAAQVVPVLAARQAGLLTDALTLLRSPWRPTHRHLKTGGEYRVIGGLDQQGAACIEKTMETCVVYEDKRGRIWVRPWSEFTDGRFAPLPKEEG